MAKHESVCRFVLGECMGSIKTGYVLPSVWNNQALMLMISVVNVSRNVPLVLMLTMSPENVLHNAPPPPFQTPQHRPAPPSVPQPLPSSALSLQGNVSKAVLHQLLL